MAIALASALLVVGMTLTDRARRAERREALLISDPLEGATTREADPPGSFAGLALSTLIALLVAYHLVIPSAAGELRHRLTALALAAAAAACAAHLLTYAHQSWNGDQDFGSRNPRSAALLAFALLTLAVCTLGTLLLSRDPQGFARRVSFVCVIALGIMAAYWNWLARVWAQQLDQGRPWTTAGHLIPVARSLSRAAILIGVLTAIRIFTGLPAQPGGG